MLRVLREAGHNEALLGMALSYWDGGTPLVVWWDEERQDKALRRSKVLAFKQGGHNKFLESIQVWLLIGGSRGFWQEFDTYRVGVTKQSASTMHTISKRELTMDDFLPGTTPDSVTALRKVISEGADISTIKANIPEGFLQTRIVCANYKVLQWIVSQRHNHRLKEWRTFCQELREELMHPYYVFNEEKL